MTVIHTPTPPIDPHAVLPDRCLKATNVPDRPCSLHRRHRGTCLPFPRRWAISDITEANPRFRAVPTQRTGGVR